MSKNSVRLLTLPLRLLVFIPFVVGFVFAYVGYWPFVFGETNRAFANIWNRMHTWTFRA